MSPDPIETPRQDQGRDVEKESPATHWARDDNSIAPRDEPPPSPCEQSESHPYDVSFGGVIRRSLSRVSSTIRPGPPPDGGLQAWLQVLGCHLVVMNSWGFVNSFGVFQAYYTTTLDRQPSDISWIGSMQTFLLFFVGTFAGRVTDAGYFRPVFLVGCAFQLVGIFTASVATTYWQLLLSHGICIGIGNGCIFTPTLTILSTYFSTKRSIAIGIGACGSVTGGVVFPIMARQLLPSAGFPWTMRAIGFILMANLVVCFLIIKPRIPPRKTGALIDWTAFKDPAYSLYAAGAFLSLWGVYCAFYFLASFSREAVEPAFSSIGSLNLLILLNGMGIVGRTVPNYVADRFGPINVFIPVSFLAGLLSLCWVAVDTATGLWVWTVFYGIFGGGIQSLFPAGLSSLTTDLGKAGIRIGMILTLVSFAVLTGPPIQGAIITAMDGKYYGAQGFSGVSLLLGMGCFAGARMSKTKKSGDWKA
ncbi:major facilitator superfamily domain-containing protein [Dactylonectria estremocensis]|uniref:Major facilitator superfamily domain-containing protein n=1 Tax=Dactylonectria estremocensis TaxID=1079267 RepID=A0A9P9DYY6_9HYPO|nr:major facilitator superfamily domain-containing protein [Dactylonectria estremocensis]